MKLRITEYLDIDLDTERWCCNRCGKELGGATESYKKGCLVAERDPHSIYPPVLDGEFTFAPDPIWIRVVEFYCPRCGTMIENEFLPAGHPLTHDIELDVEALKRKRSIEDP